VLTSCRPHAACFLIGSILLALCVIVSVMVVCFAFPQLCGLGAPKRCICLAMTSVPKLCVSLVRCPCTSSACHCYLLSGYPSQLPLLVLMELQRLQLAAAVCLGRSGDVRQLSGLTANTSCRFKVW
jgi:hypothetical protein